MEQCFTYMEKRHSKISFSSGHWSPMASGSFLAADTVQLALLWCDRRTLFPPCRGQMYHWGWPGTFWLTWLSWTKDCTLSLKQRKIFPHGDKSSTGCEDSLSHDKKVFQAQGLSIFMQPEQGLKDSMLGQKNLLCHPDYLWGLGKIMKAPNKRLYWD